MRFTGLLAVASLLFTTVLSVSADTSNYWINPGGGYSGDFTNTAHWSAGTAPVNTEQVFFTNEQGSAYTVQFTTNRASGALHVEGDSVIFDLNGWNWTSAPALENPSQLISNGAAASAYVKFSSSSDTNDLNGNVADFGNHPQRRGYLRPGSTLVVDDSLGYPVQVTWVLGVGSMDLGADILVSGPGTQLTLGRPNSGRFNSYTVVSNQAVLSTTGPQGFFLGHFVSGATTVVDNATIATSVGEGADLRVGARGQGTLILQNGSQAYADNHTQVGTDGTGAGPFEGNLFLDDSTLVTLSMQLGNRQNGAARGQVHVLNGSELIVSNWLAVTSQEATPTNTLVLNGSTITLGGGATAGVLTNAGVMRVAGTIRGVGAANALLYVGQYLTNGAPESGHGVLEIGSSLGTLTLEHVDLELDISSETLWEFSDTGLDQIINDGGSASVLGSNLFSLAAGAATPIPGSSYGLGSYDFIIGSNITWNPQYSDLTALLAGYGLVQDQDYQFGLINLDGGLQALRLQFVPEPSTMLLLLGGGLMLYRWRRRS